MKLARLAALLALPFLAPAQAQAPQKPKLVVVISVDQFSADLFNQYRQHFDAGLQRLSRGVVFPLGYQSHNATETCPGHSTILTGSHPARTGIIANNWFNLKAPREDKNVYCSEDERVPGSTHDKYTVSTIHLRVPALGDYMKRADPRSRVAVASGKDRAAIMMGGYGPDQRWYWNGKEYTGTGSPTPEAVTVTNREVAELIAQPRPLYFMVCPSHSSSSPLQPAVHVGHLNSKKSHSKSFPFNPYLWLIRITPNLYLGCLTLIITIHGHASVFLKGFGSSIPGNEHEKTPEVLGPPGLAGFLTSEVL